MIKLINLLKRQCGKKDKLKKNRGEIVAQRTDSEVPTSLIVFPVGKDRVIVLLMVFPVGKDKVQRKKYLSRKHIFQLKRASEYQAK